MGVLALVYVAFLLTLARFLSSYASLAGFAQPRLGLLAWVPPFAWVWAQDDEEGCEQCVRVTMNFIALVALFPLILWACCFSGLVYVPH